MNIEVVIPEGKIDIHNIDKKYKQALKKLRENKKFIEKNKDLILKFLRDCELGKTLKNRAKKKISASRCNRLLDMLKFMYHCLNKPFDELTQDELEAFIFDFEKDKYLKKNGDKFSETTKVYYKIGIRKFYKWLKEKSNKGNIKDLDFSFMETYEKNKEIPALKRVEVEKMVEQQSDIRNKAIIMMLFDSGARIDEFLNIRLKHIIKKEDYYMIRIEYSKTKPRTISIPFCTRYLENWLSAHPDNKNPEALLWINIKKEKGKEVITPLGYDSIRMLIRRSGKKILNKHINLHLFRHSSASYYCNKLNPYQLCYRYGWTMSSKMPSRYIDREGVGEKEVAKIIKADEISKFKEENKSLKEDLISLKVQYSGMENRFEERFIKKLMQLEENQMKLTKILRNSKKGFDIVLPLNKQRLK